ncbi:shikimate dehydrogenase [Algicella marina]|uniref:Shikimate dehydrogenase (NADP(+)) n=1 Tax=Algicella marina TaxID=2683284 RepID=A0A6P1T4B2_9RHOB|nr:shikimate dehydrogenase [Algicella marina]QHQ36595.1 shikimate dehydrogenase [Algicella marina]
MTAETPPLAGVIGWPVAHSLSPKLHGHWLKRYNLRGYYVPLGIRPQDFESSIRSLPKLGFRGVNLTIPYKETILSMADAVSDRASLIGAANTITFREDGSISADNTDGYGFLENLRQNAPGWDVRNGPALVLGAGGASRAVVSSLLNAGVPEIRLANRTRQRSEILRDQFGAKISVIDWNRASDAAEDTNLIVNTTSLGMSGKPDLQFSLANAPEGALVTDVVYTPLETQILADARARGNPTVDGLGMLLFQGIPGFESWFGYRPEVDETVRQIVLSG